MISLSSRYSALMISMDELKDRKPPNANAETLKRSSAVPPISPSSYKRSYSILL